MRTLSTSPVHPDEAGYRCEDGLIVDPADHARPTSRRAYLTYEQQRAQRLAEEDQWAARSGPVRIISPGRKTA